MDSDVLTDGVAAGVPVAGLSALPIVKPAQSPGQSAAPETTAFAILGAISLSHFLNDVIQSLVSAIYPMLKLSLHLDFGQIGLITLVFQGCASVFQPVIGMFADKRPMPYSLAVGMGASLAGLLMLSVAWSLGIVLLAAGLIGIGSSVFHPEASRVARMASGGRHGFAQSVFQVGGTGGTAVGPLLAAFFILPFGQESIAWFSILALVAMGVLVHVGRWYARNRALTPKRRPAAAAGRQLSQRQVVQAITVLFVLVISKYVYMTSLSSYLPFYLMDRFGVSVQTSQVVLFAYLAAMALGTLVGGPLGDRIGRKYVIWGSILGVLPFTLAMPYVGFGATIVLLVLIGLILSSAFSAIIVYAQELVPHRAGMIAGLFFGLAFGVSAVGAAALGEVADHTGIEFIYKLCSVLPAIGLLTVLLPNVERRGRA
jgi:FSR family fosmidomycin resistance protein-like MFS transporter